ncbi:uncharacterized protein [Pocillopora verrucosa]|uniref:uncharacterized protein n=1 Tax=Pocillopora verrucosa TaxID=203993 RepID=UPI00334049DB
MRHLMPPVKKSLSLEEELQFQLRVMRHHQHLMLLVKKCLFRRALTPLLINLPSSHHHLSPVERRSNPAGSNGDESLQ